MEVIRKFITVMREAAFAREPSVTGPRRRPAIQLLIKPLEQEVKEVSATSDVIYSPNLFAPLPIDEAPAAAFTV